MKSTAPAALDHGLEVRLSISNVAELLGVSVRTLYNWRNQGYGPPSFRVGSLVRYRKEDVLAWEQEQLAKEGH